MKHALFSIMLWVFCVRAGTIGLTYNDAALRLATQPSTKVQTPAAPVFQTQPALERKSVGTALLLSLLVPGAGEYYAGEKGQAQFFFGVEIAAWAAWLFNGAYYQSLRADYQAYAATHAALGPAGKDDQFWIDIGKFDDVYAFNDKRLQDRQPERVYDPVAYNWQWDSRDNRFTYDRRRLNAAAIKDRQLIYTTAIILNHLVSAINGMRLVRRFNARLASGTSYQFFTGRPASGDGVTLGLMARF